MSGLTGSTPRDRRILARRAARARLVAPDCLSPVTYGWEMLLSSSVSILAFVVQPSTSMSPSTTTVPVATASHTWPTKRPVNPTPEELGCTRPYGLTAEIGGAELVLSQRQRYVEPEDWTTQHPSPVSGTREIHE